MGRKRESDEAATDIQRAFRQYSRTKKKRKMANDFNQAARTKRERKKAATDIQRAFRHYKRRAAVRRRTHGSPDHKSISPYMLADHYTGPRGRQLRF